MHRKYLLLLITIITIGIFALPSTVSLFAGQHVWYDLTAGGNDIPCEKCHADVADEMTHTEPHADMKCWYCHKTANLTGFTYASGDSTGSTPGKEAHAASTVECMACHQGFGIDALGTGCMQTNCHGFGPTTLPHPVEWLNEPCGNCHAGYTVPHFDSPLEAGGFNLTINSSDTGSAAAHKAFVEDAIMNSTLMAGANEACIACHTMIGVKLSWRHRRSLEFNIDVGEPQTTTTGVHNWTMTKWSVNGTANATVWGNTTGAGSTSYWNEWPGNVSDIYS